MQRSTETYIYLANTHSYKNDLLLLAGSTHNNGECVRTLLIKNQKTLQPGFILNENKQIVRSSWCNDHVRNFLSFFL